MRKTKCLNCNKELDTEFLYCSFCGQKKIKGDYKIKDLVLHFFEDYFSFDNKILRTLMILITKPGQLTVDFMAGKRAKFVPPLRLYLFVAFVCMVGISYLNDFKSESFDNNFIVVNIEGSGAEPDAENGFAKSLGLELGNTFKEKSSLIVLLEIPLFSFFIYLFFFLKKRFYMESFVMGLHLQTIFFMTLFLGTVISLKFSGMDGVSLAIVGYSFYSFFALKKYFDNSYFKTVLKLTMVLLFQGITILGLMIIYLLISSYINDEFRIWEPY